MSAMGGLPNIPNIRFSKYTWNFFLFYFSTCCHIFMFFVSPLKKIFFDHELLINETKFLFVS